MRNPYFVNPIETNFNTAAEAVDAYLKSNADKEFIDDNVIEGIAGVAPVLVSGKLPEGHVEELLNRVGAIRKKAFNSAPVILSK